jgi:hypothetical protein
LADPAVEHLLEAARRQVSGDRDLRLDACNVVARPQRLV